MNLIGNLDRKNKIIGNVPVSIVTVSHSLNSLSL
jgi:hypothetical protein